MARKTISDLKGDRQLTLIADGVQKAAQRRAEASPWAVVGIDTSMTSIALTAIAYDPLSKRMTKVKWAERRWTTEDDDYLMRLCDAAKVHEMVIESMPIPVPTDRVFIFQEEPVPLGMMRAGRLNMQSGWIKQQCEISGAVLGGLMRWGYTNIWQINNMQWKKTLRNEGVTIHKMPEGKFDIKAWAIQAYGLPELPDLVASKTGSKIPRPESGYGAKAKPVQPDDVYDAAACMAYGCDFIADTVNSHE